MRYTIFTSLILIPFLAFTQVKHSCKADANSTLKVINKYGDISINVHQVDSVYITINMNFKTTNAGEQKEIENNIDFSFKKMGRFINAETIFGSKYSGFFNELKDNMSGALGDNSSDVEIDYIIYVPEKINLFIENKYGDIYLDEVKGKTNIELSNGDINGGNLSQDFDINLRFGNIILNNVNSGQLTLLYGDVEINRADNININGKSSEIKISNVNSLKFTSRRDKYYIENCNELNGSGTFTHLNINNLQEEINVLISYGRIIIDQLYPGTALINAKYTESDITLSADFAGKFNLIAEKTTTGINIPDFTPKKSINNETTTYEGVIDNNSENALLKMETYKGNLKISKN